ncbi:hypothetical protein E2562_038552 [Oryza meyeriana var. granulata]|uniref:Uncharacterized protein n=1 Tax=Oryza meyeriana var. granulata TaxID=110450 RepID=A0A6G1F273_9ORYZ|nr:hypothetical protein E2562_038552 [Oryza meyeriana var. granulata]
MSILDRRLEAIGKIKQLCSDFIMARNIRCRGMIEDVQKQKKASRFQLLIFQPSKHAEEHICSTRSDVYTSCSIFSFTKTQ